MIDTENFDQIVKWTEEDYGSFQSGSRNDFVFALASKCCHKGIDRQVALREITSRYKEKDFTYNEIRSSVDSAYKRNGNAKPIEEPKIFKPKISDFTTRDINPDEFEFWRQFQITPQVLAKNHCLAVDHYYIGTLRIESTPQNPVFCYKINNDTYKIYRPLDKKYKFSWYPENNKPAGWYFGLDHCRGDQEVFLTGGEKDVMTLSSQGKEAFTLNSETASMPQNLAEELKSRYKRIVVLYDSDSTGVKHSEKICEKFGFVRGILPAGVKDVSDLIRDGRSLEEIKYEEAKDINPAPQLQMDFYRIKWDKEGNISELKINFDKYDKILYSLGFRRYDVKNDYIFIKIQNQIIEQVTHTKIQDGFMSYLRNLPEKLDKSVTRQMLIEKFKSNPAAYFSENRFTFLSPDSEIIFNSDTKHEAFIYFKNGYVRCSPGKFELVDYKRLQGYIWKNQVIKRDFIMPEKQNLSLKDFGMYGEFIFNISGRKDDRWRSICSIIGYLLHSFTEGKLKAVVLTDSVISEIPDGRTGKTLFAKATGYIKNYCEINGKKFKSAKDFSYQTADLDTQILCLNDVKNSKQHPFDFQDVFNDITEGIEVEKKNKQPFRIFPKIIITTNRTLDIEGASAKDRSIEFEFSDHYSDKLGPNDEFGCWFFSNDWSIEEWSKFDTFMMWCICLYLKEGVIETPHINLNRRKLLDRTNSDFLEFMDEKMKNGEIKIGHEYSKKELHESFLEEYPDNKEINTWKLQNNFTKALKTWATYTPGISRNVTEKKSGSNRYIIFCGE